MRIESKIENTWQCLLVQRAGTKEEEEERENERREKEKLEIKQAIGLSSLLKKIVESVSIQSSQLYVQILMGEYSGSVM